NPVIDKVHITMKDIENYKLIQLYDFTGRSFPITSIDKRTDNLEIDMAELSSGNYFIRIVMEDSARVVQIIKK
ncbi:MAG: T9SS type A sorting domain-containing protein, partial [Bacteroidota bacterium]|nr:T9SS type A sorting domain-containing protein [Bacteroidota bacterium]